MLASLVGMFPALDVNLVTQTLQACNYIVKEASNFAFALATFRMLSRWPCGGIPEASVVILAIACRPVRRPYLEAVTMVCIWLGAATLADAPAAVWAPFCILGLPVGGGQQQCLTCCC